MFRHYLKTTLRNLLKNKTSTVINVLGLSTGLGISFLILLFIMHELSYDRQHPNSQNTYRIIAKEPVFGSYVSEIPYFLGAELYNSYPEIKDVTRIIQDREQLALLTFPDSQSNYESQLIFAEKNIFDFFQISLIQGNPQQVLSEPFKAIISKRLAAELFKNIDPYGKTITIAQRNQTFQVSVEGIYQDIESNSHLQTDVILSMDTYFKVYDKKIIY